MAYMHVPGNSPHEEIQLDGVGTYLPKLLPRLTAELH